MLRTETQRARLRRGGYIIIGLLILVVFALSVVQVWFLMTTENVPAYGSIQANPQGQPPADDRGAYLLLNDPHNPKYAGDLLKLVETSEPGVVDQASEAHLLSREVNAVLLQSAAFGEDSDYRVYRLGQDTTGPMAHVRDPEAKQMRIRPQGGTWEPGDYLIDVPSEGMFGGRSYFQFAIDPGQ